MTFTCLGYLLIPSVWRELGAMSWRDIALFLGIGCVVCMHWLTFYGSIKLGDSASITLTCLGSTTFFASIIEPLLLKTEFSYRDLAVGCIVICGVLQVYFALPHTPEHEARGVHYGMAVLVGTLSALLASLFSVLNKMNIKRASPLAISTIEMLGGSTVLWCIVPSIYGKHTVWFPTLDINNLRVDTMRSGPWDLIWVAILSVACTNFTYFTSTKCLHHIRAFTANLITNLEPIYGIILGALIFHENRDLNYHFYIGTGIILTAIFGNTLIPHDATWCCSTPNSHRISSSSSGSDSSHGYAKVSQSASAPTIVDNVEDGSRSVELSEAIGLLYEASKIDGSVIANDDKIIKTSQYGDGNSQGLFASPNKLGPRYDADSERIAMVTSESPAFSHSSTYAAAAGMSSSSSSKTSNRIGSLGLNSSGRVSIHPSLRPGDDESEDDFNTV